MSMISIRHMRKDFAASTPLKDVNLEINKGEVISVIGPSGTGKSTLLRCICMLEEPTSGQVFINGTDVTADKHGNSEALKSVGMVFQSFNLFEHMNAVENVMYAPVKVKKMPKDEARKLAYRLLDEMSLSGQALAYPDELSGGQKQRVAIARTLAMEPDIILFDEPTSALDPTMVGQVQTAIRGLARQGMTMMIVTHEMEFARSISTRVLYMDQGEVYEDGTPEQIFEHPQRNRTRQFMQRMRVLHQRIEPEKFDFLQFSSDIEVFGHQHMMDQKKIGHAVAILEELCAGYMVPALAHDGHLHFILECSERDQTANVTVLWKGSDIKPLPQDDPLASSILSICAGKISYEPGKVPGTDNNTLRFEGL